MTDLQVPHEGEVAGAAAEVDDQNPLTGLAGGEVLVPEVVEQGPLRFIDDADVPIAGL